MTHTALQNLGQLLSRWWHVDRIRIAGSTGRLLRLVPGDRLLIHQQLLLVRKRSLLQNCIEADADADDRVAAGVEYRLVNLLAAVDDGEANHGDTVVVSANEEWRLQILLPIDSQPHAHRLWIGEAAEELLEEEIVLLRSTDER